MADTAMLNRENYVGETRKFIREGFGVYTYENKFFRYEGEWVNGKKHGHGKLQMADGSYYEGEFRNGEIEGYGYKYFSPSGNTYSGEFHQGELTGQGVMNYGNGTVYEGEWCRNSRQGYGVLRKSDNSVYQGYLHAHKRHGEGTQIYSDGNRYDGDWVNDKRQGHGEYRQADGTIYDGQWRNDLYNGQGTIVHSSGFTYTGIWVNGLPENMASRLQFKLTETPLEVLQGSQFSLEVITVNDEGEVVEDNGRELRISAGYKHIMPKEDKSRSTEGSSSGLFDIIEDVEEKPVETPFGYEIVSYPLTDQLRPELENREGSIMGAVPRSKTDLSEIAVPEHEEVKNTKVFGEDADRVPAEGEVKVEVARTESPSADDTTLGISNEPTSTDLQGAAPPQTPLDGTTLPPPISSQKTQDGSVSFLNLILPAAPPMYRPFVVMDMEEQRKADKKSSKSKPGSRQGKAESDEESRPSTKSKKLGDERCARPAEDDADSLASSDISRSQTSNDNLYAEPGEYVIMIEDVTNPPFLGITLEPAFLLVKVTLPSKPKPKRKPSVKGPKWDTSSHIVETVTRSKTDMAMKEFQEALNSSLEQ